jgi:hypothetical protein
MSAKVSFGLSISDPARRGEEMKYVPLVLPTSVSTTVSNVSLGVGAGAEVTQRIGRTVVYKRLHLCAQLTGGQTNVVADDARNSFRIVIADADIGVTPTFTLNDILDPRFIAGLQKVYYDKTFSLATPGRDSTGYLPASREIFIDVPVDKIQTYFGSATNAQSRSSLCMFCVSDSVAVPSPGFTNGGAYVTFTDY